MGILTGFVAGVVHLAVVLLDVAIAFHVVHLLTCRFTWKPLEALERAGKPLVDCLVQGIQERLEDLGNRPVAARHAAGAVLAGLLLVRLLAVWLFHLAFVP